MILLFNVMLIVSCITLRGRKFEKDRERCPLLVIILQRLIKFLLLIKSLFFIKYIVDIIGFNKLLEHIYLFIYFFCLCLKDTY